MEEIYTFEERDRGHLSDTKANRKLILDLVDDSENFLGVDEVGNSWYAKTLPDGKQLWASVRDKFIRNGGLNKTVRTFNLITSISRMRKS